MMPIEFDHLMEFYKKLIDNESKELFIKRLSFTIHKDIGILSNDLFDDNKCYKCPELEEFFKDKNLNNGVLIYGAGQFGIYTYRLLRNLSVKVMAFVDSDKIKQNSGMCGIPVISPESAIHDFGDNIIILATLKWKKIFYERLLMGGYNRNMILWPRYDRLIASCGEQYFDVKEIIPQNDEIFIDGGALNMKSSLDFINWCNGNYKKIYAFEPDVFSADRCRNIINAKRLNEKIELYQAGTWSEDTILNFNGGIEGASRISSNGEYAINVKTIDSVLDGKKATFIKLDVEGAELNTLKGAIKTIKEYKPKLAISVYHKPMDIIDIPIFLESLNVGYKYVIRHYSSTSDETVLYAYSN